MNEANLLTSRTIADPPVGAFGDADVSHLHWLQHVTIQYRSLVRDYRPICVCIIVFDCA
jgi:hypothetical protein